MDQQDILNHTIDLIHSYCQVLDLKGVTYSVPSDETLLGMKLWEARGVLKELVGLALFGPLR